jgi:hypothetical protein
MHFKVRGDKKNTRQVNEEMSLEAKKILKIFFKLIFFNMNVFILQTQAGNLNAFIALPRYLF